MALVLDGTNGVSLVQDGVVTAADLSSTLDLTGKTVTLPAGTGGKVLQVVSSEYTGGQLGTTSSSLSELTTNLRVTITPTSTSSKLLIIASSFYEINRDSGNDNEGQIQIWDVTNSAEIRNYFVRCYDRGGSGILLTDTSTTQTLISPNTTSPVTYTLRYANITAGAGGSFLRLNRDTELTVMEIAG